tara:strand:- start:185 stop:337 length:153 start_codon:yes stop_codon:yes gene_type:complete
MSSDQNPYEQIFKFVAEARILTSIFWGVSKTTKALKIGYEIIEEFKELKT